MKIVLKASLVISLLLALGGRSSSAVEQRAGLPISVVNHSRFPVHATAVTLDETEIRAILGIGSESAIRVRLADGGVPAPLLRGEEEGRSLIRVYVSLPPASRLDLVAERADRWQESALVEANAGTENASGVIRNGLLRVEFGNQGWNLGFAGSAESREETRLITNGKLDFWIDDQDRGRILNSDPRDLGLARYAEATLIAAEASVEPDGRPVLRIVRRMNGLASEMQVTETFELLPGLPVLVCRVRWENQGDQPRWIAYVGSGDGIRGNWARQSLMPNPLIERKKSPLLGDLNGGETRCAWLGGLCRISMESPETGCGVGLSTVLPTPNEVGQGSMIWGCGWYGFQCNFIDPVQGQFPFRVEPRGTLENGIAILASQAGTCVFRDTVELWRTIQAGKRPALSSPVAVYVGGRPAVAQTVSEVRGPLDLLVDDDGKLQAALRMDFNRHFECRVSAETPLEIQARPLDRHKPAVTLLSTDRIGKHVVDLNATTGWTDQVSFVLEAKSARGEPLSGLSIVETLPEAPEPLSPLPGASFTDIATMFRWRALPLVVDYDLQWSTAADFGEPVEVRVSTSDPFPWYLPPDEQLPAAGKYYWRVRGVKGGVLGSWSPSCVFTVDTDRSTRPVARPITAKRPLFTIEASKVTDFTDFRPDLPADLAPYLAIVAEGYVAKGLTIDRFVQGLEKLPYAILIRSHPPTWVNLADLEWVCQNLPNFAGIQGGETLSNLYAQPRPGEDNGDADYHRRMTTICAKYGKIYQEADGTYRDDKWQDLMDKQGAFVRQYGPWLVLTQKNNIIRRQFYSQSAAMGLWLGGITHQHGAWEDGGFYWQNAGFGKLGECFGERSGVLRTMPCNFWSLVFVMGIGRGCGVYSLDGQTLMENPKEIARFPHARFPAAIWTTDGKTSDTFQRFVAPLIRGIVEHDLIPTREQVLKNVQLAVYNDKQISGDGQAWPYYAEYGPLYAGTYGFRRMGNIDGQLWEFFPNTGRYYYVPVLPQGNETLAPHVRNLAVSALQDVTTVRQTFDAAYPNRYDGGALVTLVGDTLTVLNTHENQDADEAFSVPLNRGRFAAISGAIGPHAYLVGKIENGGRRLWLQTNAEYPDRTMTLTVRCQDKPAWRVEPAAAADCVWNETAQTLMLRVVHAQGAVEVTVE
ncbi:MAG: hypothetical protein KJ000_11025 [Pirellulaceae bacterium]|nr:hypothetical protein [Pirellulaceae bacterium]